MSRPLSDNSAASFPEAVGRAAHGSTTPSRAGNAMPRARAGILNAAAQLVAEHGLHAATMAGVARRAGVAKATVYNHVRDRDELVAALLVDQWSQLQKVCAERPREQRLSTAATWVSDSPVLAGLRRYNPDALVTLGGLAVTDPQVTATINTWIPEGRDPDAALRWLISFAIAPHQLTREPQILVQSD